jgi:glycosyltransferase involved in cell wall biosynthesis
MVEYDKDQMRDAIFKILSDEELGKRFGEEGRRLVMEEFGWEKVVRTVEDVYSNVIGR